LLRSMSACNCWVADYHLQVHYLASPAANYVRAAVETVIDIHKEDLPGDVLVFLTGRSTLREELHGSLQLGGCSGCKLLWLFLSASLCAKCHVTAVPSCWKAQKWLSTLHPHPQTSLFLPCHAGTCGDVQPQATTLPCSQSAWSPCHACATPPPTGQHEVEEAVRQLDEAAEKLGRSSGYRDKLLALPLYAGEPANTFAPVPSDILPKLASHVSYMRINQSKHGTSSIRTSMAPHQSEQAWHLINQIKHGTSSQLDIRYVPDSGFHCLTRSIGQPSRSPTCSCCCQNTQVYRGRHKPWPWPLHLEE
jgi:hypothetical protein